MTKLVLLNCRTFVAGADLSGSGNRIEITEGSAEKAVTNWRSGGATEVIAGLASTDIIAEGQWEAGDPGLPDDEMWANRRVLEPWSVGPSDQSDTAPGSLMYLTKALRTSSRIWGGVGDVASWMAQAKGSLPLARGLCMHPSGVARSANGSGTAYQLGAVAANRSLYANLHVLSVAGTATPTLTVNIQSDNGAGFASPAAVGSFAAASAVGGQPIRIPGPFTDDWWRVSWTVTGTTPSFLFLVSMGIE